MVNYYTRVTLLVLSVLYFQLRLTFVHGAVGKATYYNPPYLPTRCYGSDASPLPPFRLFVAAGEGVWDNGAACGREYLISCMSAPQRGTCIPGKTIQVKVVDSCAGLKRNVCGSSTLVMSRTAYSAIANIASSYINVEFKEV